MTVVEFLLRCCAVLVLGDPAVAALPLVAVAALGVTAVAVAVLVAHLIAVVLRGVPDRTARPGAAPDDLVTRIAWSHPDADGHRRSRAPGAAPTA